MAAAAAKSLQSCPTLCDPRDCSLPGSPVPGILQARTLEWVAISFSNAWNWKVKVKSLSLVQLLATPWTVAHQAPPSMGFSRQECWSGVPLPSPNQTANFDNVKPQLLLHQPKRRNNVWKLTKFSKRNKSTVYKLENISSRVNSNNLLSRHVITILLEAKNNKKNAKDKRTSNNFYRKKYFEWQ